MPPNLNFATPTNTLITPHPCVIPWTRGPRWIAPRLLTYRNNTRIHFYCFKLINLELMHYVAINNEYTKSKMEVFKVICPAVWRRYPNLLNAASEIQRDYWAFFFFLSRRKYKEEHLSLHHGGLAQHTQTTGSTGISLRQQTLFRLFLMIYQYGSYLVKSHPIQPWSVIHK